MKDFSIFPSTFLHPKPSPYISSKLTKKAQKENIKWAPQNASGLVRLGPNCIEFVERTQ
jgi:hypothetical protein